MNPDEIWKTLSYNEKMELISHIKQPSIGYIDKIPSDVIRYIGYFITNDGQTWSSFANSCKHVSKSLPNFYDVCMKNINVVPFSCFVHRMIYKCSKIGIKLEIMTKRTFDEKCRYININNSVKIDKWSGLILNDQASMPRGYVMDQNPEFYFSQNGHLISIIEREKRDPNFKDQRKKMELYLDQKSSELKQMSNIDKKRKLASMWDESHLRRNRFIQ